MIARKQPLKGLRTLPWGHETQSVITPPPSHHTAARQVLLCHAKNHQRASRELRELLQIRMFLNIFLPDKKALCRSENGCHEPIAHLLKDPITLLH